MEQPILYRKRMIPKECVLLKDDIILEYSEDILVTKWQALHPKKDLHHGYSCYYLKEGYKISKFYTADNTLLYYYCDIISPEYDTTVNSLTVLDLLIDVVVYPDGFVKVVDLDEIVPALDEKALSDSLLKQALLSCNQLLQKIYAGEMEHLAAPISRYE